MHLAIGPILLIAFSAHFAQGCNVTLWTKVRFQHNGGATSVTGGSHPPQHCFFHLPNSKWIRRDHLIEIAFSSFSMGRVVNNTCSGGYLKIVEDTGSTTLGGEFCGQLGQSHTYLTTSKSVTLYSNAEAKIDHFNAYYDVLSLDAVKRRYPEMRRSSDGEHAPDSLCDVLLHNCKSQCRISSPHYPSAYPRNVTCRYHVTFDRPDWQVVLGGQPGDRYDIAYHAQCQYDHLKVYERTAAGDLTEMATLCGRAKFPQIVSKGNEVIVEFTAAASGLFHDGFRLTVGHRQRRKTHEQSIISPCDQVIHSSNSSQGHVFSARHWFPKNTDCSWTLSGQDRERVWIEIRSKQHRRSGKFAQQPAANVSTCYHQVLISEEDSSPSLTVCESNLTRMNFFLSRSRRISVRFSSRMGSLDGSDLDFDLFYMFVASENAETRIKGSICDHLVTEPRGSLALIGNRLLLRQRHLKCKYRIQAQENQRIRIDIRTKKFDPIRQCDDDLISSTDCAASDGTHFDKLTVSDVQDVLYCLCSAGGNTTTIYSSSNVAYIQLDLSNIFNQAYKDTDIYQFHVDYAAIPNRCGQVINGPGSGHGAVHMQGHLHGEMCSWFIKMSFNDRVLFKINNLSIGDDCRSNYFVIRFLGNGAARQERRFCPGAAGNGEFLSPFPTRYAYVELRSSLAQTRFHLKWNVLQNQQSDSCQYQCPNSTWCLPSALVCNGEINCPQNDLYGYLLDESPVNCSWNSRLQDYYHWFLVIVVALIFTVIVSLLVVLYSIRRQRKGKLTK